MSITREELIEKAAKALVADVGIPWENARQDPFRAAARTVIRIALEAAAEVVSGEYLAEEIDASDVAYDNAIYHALKTIRSLIPENDND